MSPPLTMFSLSTCVCALALTTHHPLLLLSSPPASPYRTKQTARKVTGDKAPRVKLQSLQKKKSKTALSLKKPTFERKTMANSFCVMCRNEGDLWICDEQDCKRVVCHKCLIVPENSLKDVTEDHVTFKCVTCHWKETEKSAPQPYFLSPIYIIKGFYSQGKPVCPEPPVITGGFQHAINAQVAPHSIALIHLHLENLEVGHAQVNMIHSLLQPYFPKGRYQFSQLPFNLTTQESLAVYQTAAFNLATSLSSYQSVILFLTTHSDEERGDLFAGFVDGVTVASEVSEVLHALFTPFTQIIRVAHIFFNVCGSVVTVEDSFNGLKKTAQLFKPKHSNIIVMMWRSQGENMEVGKLVVEKLVWTDKFIRPWGNYLPVQCPQCGSIQKWVCGAEGKTNSYECKYTHCGKGKGHKNTSIPPKQYTFSIPEGAIQFPHGKKGTSSWLQFTL
ncbi:hypothetical protein EDC04DRAFT_2610216 [Pisolithus marmoratus]|nr:hypothetical protein EDC04DRAFT_2610216 [Pisolithus marmoratus]